MIDREQHAEFRALRDAAGERLRAGTWRLRLDMQPSFEDCWAIGVIGDTTTARRWDRSADADKLRNPIERLKHPRTLTPTIVEHAAASQPGAIDRLLAGLADVRIPLNVLPDHITLDGVIFAVHSTARASLSLSWNTQPGPWKPLALWFAQTWRELASHLDIPHDNPFPWEDSRKGQSQ